MTHQFVHKLNSICKMIAYKPFVQDLYVAARKRSKEIVQIGDSIRDFAYAPQRYTSESKSLCRLVLTFDAACAVLAQVPLIRGATSAEGQACLETMAFLSDEVALQLAMLGDVALQLAGVVRECDRSDVDEAELPAELERHILIMRRLFCDGAVVEFQSLTKVMLQILSTPRTFIILGRPKTIGSLTGVNPEVVYACLRRMQAFVALASQVIAAEFPHFDIVASFRVFALSDRGRGNSEPSLAATAGQGSSAGTAGPQNLAATAKLRRDQETCLKRLAQVVGVCSFDLVHQFQSIEPYACQLFKQQSTSNLHAWSTAVHKMKKTRPVGALLEVLIRYAAWVASSSDVERTFAKTSALRKGHSVTVVFSIVRSSGAVLLCCLSRALVRCCSVSIYVSVSPSTSPLPLSAYVSLSSRPSRALSVGH